VRISFSKGKEKFSLADIHRSDDGLESLNRCILDSESVVQAVSVNGIQYGNLTRSNILKVLRKLPLADYFRTVN